MNINLFLRIIINNKNIKLLNIIIKNKIIIDLKAFNGDESRINYNVTGKKLTVFGSAHVKDKNFKQDISFSQDFLLPDKIRAQTYFDACEKAGDSLEESLKSNKELSEYNDELIAENIELHGKILELSDEITISLKCYKVENQIYYIFLFNGNKGYKFLYNDKLEKVALLFEIVLQNFKKDNEEINKNIKPEQLKESADNIENEIVKSFVQNQMNGSKYKWKIKEYY